MEKKLAIASYNKPNKLLNQRSEILNVCRCKNSICKVSRFFLGFFSTFKETTVVRVSYSVLDLPSLLGAVLGHV